MATTGYMMKAQILYNLKHFDEALFEYDHVLRLDSSVVLLESRRATTLLALKRYEEALTAYNRAIILDPTIASAYSGKADVLLALERYSEAIETYDSALALDPTATHIYIEKGHAFKQLAQQAYENARRLGFNKEDQMQHTNHSYSDLKLSSIHIEELEFLYTTDHPNKFIICMEVVMSQVVKFLQVMK